MPAKPRTSGNVGAEDYGLYRDCQATEQSAIIFTAGVISGQPAIPTGVGATLNLRLKSIM